jgi:uncharacterized protein (TIGR02145 family)
MKKSTVILILFVLTILNIQAQNYLINFAGIGASNVVGTVKVDNLTSGASVTINGYDVLHLIPAVGIGNLDINNETLHIYPNPMAEQAMLTFVASESGNAVISIVDLSAKTVCQFSSMLSTGIHSFRISGICLGMYFVKVTGTNYNYSTKLISQSSLQSTARIEYVSSVKNPASNQLKNITATIDMPYTDGDQLLYKGISGIYSTIITDVPVNSKTMTFNFAACTDNDGNNYTTVQIGTGKSVAQIWMAENLKVTHYRNGDAIPNITDSTVWGGLTNGAYCWYKNDEASYKNIYGALYNWYSVHDSRNLCPTGWHVSTEAEWTLLTDTAGGINVAGSKLKETNTTHWSSPNSGATNETGFTALPGGFRNNDPAFGNIGNFGYFWTATEIDAGTAWEHIMGYNFINVISSPDDKTVGFSVRCVKD